MDRRISRIILQDKGLLLQVVLCCLIASLADLAVPYFVRLLLDKVLVKQDLSELPLYVGAYLGISVLSVGADCGMNVYSARAVSRSLMRGALALTEHVAKVPLQLLPQMEAAELARRIDDDLTDAVSFLILNGCLLISCLLSLVGSFYLVSQIATLWLGILAVFCVGYIFFLTQVQYLIKKVYRDYKNALTAYFQQLSSYVANLKPIKIHGLAALYGKRLEQSFTIFEAANVHRAKISYFLANNRKLLTFLFYGALFAVGISQVGRGEISLGSFVSLQSIFELSIGTLSVLVTMLNNYQNCLVAVERLAKLWDLPVEKEGVELTSGVRSVSLEKISLSYGEKVVLRELSYELHAGRVYAVTGRNGTGKSTLLTLLAGIVTPTAGRILVNGQELTSLDLAKLRLRHIGYVEQEPFILDADLETNLTWQRDRGQCLEKLQNFGFLLPIHVRTLAQTLDPTQLSGGEKQRIALVRTVLKGASLLLLDEPTAALDKQGVQDLCALLTKLKKGKIIILVSHDAQVLACADEIIALRGLRVED